MAVTDRALSIAARLITARADPEEVLKAVLTAAVEATRATRGFVALIDRRNGELLIRNIAGVGWTPEKQEIRLRTGAGVHEGITGYVATHAEPYHTGDADNDLRYYPLFDDVRSELAVPLIRSGDRVVGVLDLESSERDAFTDEDETVVGALAALAAVAVSMAEHHRREQELTATAQELSRSGDLEQQLNLVTESAARILQALDSSLFLLDADRKILRLASSHGPLRTKVCEATYLLGEGLTGWTAEHGEPVRVGEPQSDPRWAGKHQEIPSERIAAFLAVPVLDETGVRGVLRVIRDRTPRSLPNLFDDDDQKTLATLASQVTVVLQRDELLRRLMQSERLAAWGQLSARAAHIIGNKVFVLKGAVSELGHLMHRDGVCGQECAELLESLTRALAEIDSVVQSFKGFVAAHEMKPADLDLSRLLDAQLKTFEPSCGEVRLRAHLADGLPPVRADPSRLGECFGELIENAISWQLDGGEVRVSTSVASAEEVAALADLHGAARYVRVDVEDDGPGVPADLKSSIFDAFVSNRGRGLGLGLAICREVIRAHGGEIREVGTPGRGGHFVVLLPAGEHEEAATEDVQDSRRR